MYLVWYCIPGEARLYLGSPYQFDSIDKAKQIDFDDLQRESSWVRRNPTGWLQITDLDFKVLYTKKREIQLSLF